MSLRLAVAGAHLEGLSGIPGHLIAALRRFAAVTVVELPEYQPSLPRRVVNRLRRIGGRSYLWEKDPRRARMQSRVLDDAAAATSADAVLVIGTESCAYSETPVPLFGFGDSIFGSRVDLYPDQITSQIAPKSFREGVLVQQRALDRMRLMFITSRFAWTRAIERLGYRVPEDKLVVTLAGANFATEVEPQPFPRDPRTRFLWIGLDWKRKGGGFAVRVVEELRRRGIDAALDVVGVRPPEEQPDFVTVHGRVTDERRKVALFAGAAAMLLPTQADLTPVAIAEAAAVGRATIATPAGGIPELVQHGRDALLIPADDPAAWADAIAAARLDEMGQRARAAYESHLNWTVIARQIVQRISDHVPPATASRSQTPSSATPASTA